jgi:hypothetical protein
MVDANASDPAMVDAIACEPDMVDAIACEPDMVDAIACEPAKVDAIGFEPPMFAMTNLRLVMTLAHLTVQDAAPHRFQSPEAVTARPPNVIKRRKPVG